MGFLDWLGGLFNSGQKPAAPSHDPAPAASNTYSFLGAPDKPAPAKSNSFDWLTAFQEAPQHQAPRQQTQQWPPAYSAPAQQPQQQEAPRWESKQANWMSSPLNEPPKPAENSLPNGQQNYMVSPNPGVKEQLDQKAATEAEVNRWFGGNGNYAPEQMSVEAYLNLPPRQRAAVDANTALVEAGKQDLTNPNQANNDQSYKDQVNQAFGDNSGSDTYAPRTMAVLKDLGLDVHGKNIDQYLNHSALVTVEDLKALAPGATAAPGNERQQNAVAFSTAATKRLSETLASGQSLLDSIRSTSDQGAELFGKPSATPPVGYANSARDADLQQAFDILSQKRSQADLTPATVNGLYAELQTKHGVTPNEVAQYFDTRLQSNEYLNASGGDKVALGGPGSSLEYLAPQDFRSKFIKEGA